MMGPFLLFQVQEIEGVREMEELWPMGKKDLQKESNSSNLKRLQKILEGAKLSY
jgi:hypothetical protein